MPFHKKFLESRPLLTTPLNFPSLPPKLYRNDFDGLFQASRENHDLTGPIATHGRRLEVYVEDDHLFLKIPQVAVRPRFTRNAVEQFLTMLEVRSRPFMHVLRRMSTEGAANVFTELIHWKFKASHDVKETPIKQTRAVSPFVCYPTSGEVGVLRGIWWSDFNRIYDDTICQIIEPFIGNLSIPLAIQTERKTMIFVVNESVTSVVRGLTIHPSLFIENFETGTKRSRFMRTVWLPAHQMPGPMNTNQIRREDEVARTAWEHILDQGLTFLDGQKEMVYEEKLFGLVDMDLWVRDWVKEDWDSSWKYLSRAAARVGQAQRQLIGRDSLTNISSRHAKSKAVES